MYVGRGRDAEDGTRGDDTPQTASADKAAAADPEFDLSHITAREQSREEIIAAAEAAAFDGAEG